MSGVDKLVHLGLYGVLGALSTQAMMQGQERPGTRALATVILGVSLFGAIDELHQKFIPGRTADPRDWLADSAGATAASLLTAAALARRERS